MQVSADLAGAGPSSERADGASMICCRSTRPLPLRRDGADCPCWKRPVRRSPAASIRGRGLPGPAPGGAGDRRRVRGGTCARVCEAGVRTAGAPGAVRYDKERGRC